MEYYYYYFLINIILIITIINELDADCPKLCECKWKNGKESVFCLNGNLTKIPTTLDSGTQVLDFTGNDLNKIIHDTFKNVGLINLQKVYLIKCKLKIIERYSFRKINNLIELDLSYNILTFIPSHIFDTINELRELKLNGNPIQSIINETFINLPQLLRLELSNCKINFIEESAFKGVETIKWLKLDGNKLLELHAITIIKLINLNGFELYKNPWNCSCLLRPLREWIMKKKISNRISPTCRYPIRLMNKQWDKLQLDEFACVPLLRTNEKFKKTIIEGTNITLNCGLIKTIDNINIKWKYKNKSITDLGEKNYKNRKKYFIDNNKKNYDNIDVSDVSDNIYSRSDIIISNNLTIINTDIHDSGVYTCIAENKAGKIENNLLLEIINHTNNNTNHLIIFIIIFTTILLFLIIILLLIIHFWHKRKQLKTQYKKTCDSGGDYEKMNRFSCETNFTQRNSNNNRMLNINKLDECPLKYYGDYKYLPSEDDDCTGYEDNLLDNNLITLNKIGGETTKLNKKIIIGNNLQQRTTSTTIQQQQQQQQHHHQHNQQQITTNWTNDTQNEIVILGNSLETNLQSVKRNNSYKDTTNDGSTSLNVITTGTDKTTIDNVGTLTSIDSIIQQTPIVLPLKGYKPNFPQHIMKKQLLNNNNGCLFTTNTIITTPTINGTSNNNNNNISSCHSNEFYETDILNINSDSDNDELKFPDLLDLPLNTNTNINKNNLNYMNIITPSYKKINKLNTNYTKEIFNTNECSLLPEIFDDKSTIDFNEIPHTSDCNNITIQLQKKRKRRYSVDSLSYLPQTTNTNNKINFLLNKQRSNSYLNLTITPDDTINYLNTYRDWTTFTSTTTKLCPNQIQQQYNKNLRIPLTATPLLDFSSLPLRTTQTPTTIDLMSSEQNINRLTSTLDNQWTPQLLYDYHTTQLEYFIKEYRKLHLQLKKVRDNYNNCKIKTTTTTSTTTTITPTITSTGTTILTPLTTTTTTTIPSPSTMLNTPITTTITTNHKDDSIKTIGQSAQFADPLMYNEAWCSTNSTTNQNSYFDENDTKNLMKKKKLLTVNSPDPPPYWLHRSTMLKNLSTSNSNLFQS